MLLEDGISYVQDDLGVKDDPDMAEGLALLPTRLEQAVVNAAEDCPGECIFIET